RPAEDARTADRERMAQESAAPPAPRAAPTPLSKPEVGSALRNVPGRREALTEAEADRPKEQAAAAAREEARRANEAARPAPRPFAEPPAAPAEPKQIAPEGAPASADALAKRAQQGAGTGQAMERAERGQAPAPPASAPPAAAAAP